MRFDVGRLVIRRKPKPPGPNGPPDRGLRRVLDAKNPRLCGLTRGFVAYGAYAHMALGDALPDQNVTQAEGIVKARVESIHRQRRLSATRPSVPAHRAVGYPGEAGSRPRQPDRPKLNPSLCKQGGVQRVRPRSPAHRPAGYPPDITA